MFYQTSLSPQVKRGAVISNKQDIYDLPNNLGLMIIEKSEKSQNLLELYTSVQLSHQNESFFNTSQKLLRNRN